MGRNTGKRWQRQLRSVIALSLMAGVVPVLGHAQDFTEPITADSSKSQSYVTAGILAGTVYTFGENANITVAQQGDTNYAALIEANGLTVNAQGKTLNIKSTSQGTMFGIRSIGKFDWNADKTIIDLNSAYGGDTSAFIQYAPADYDVESRIHGNLELKKTGNGTFTGVSISKGKLYLDGFEYTTEAKENNNIIALDGAGLFINTDGQNVGHNDVKLVGNIKTEHWRAYGNVTKTAKVNMALTTPTSYWQGRHLPYRVVDSGKEYTAGELDLTLQNGGTWIHPGGKRVGEADEAGRAIISYVHKLIGGTDDASIGNVTLEAGGNLEISNYQGYVRFLMPSADLGSDFYDRKVTIYHAEPNSVAILRTDNNGLNMQDQEAV